MQGSREKSLEIARAIIAARASMDGDTQYDHIEDDEGYLVSVLVAMRHLADDQLSAYPDRALNAYHAQDRFSYELYLSDMEEARALGQLPTPPPLTTLGQ